MSDGRRYVMEIRQDAPDEDSPPRISAVMQFTAEGEPHLIELTVSSTTGGPVSSETALRLDFDRLAFGLREAVLATGGIGAGAGSLLPRVNDAGAPQVHPREGGQQEGTRLAKSEAATVRAYRKMPDPDEVTRAWHELESVGKLARHYDVPRYTAQAWVDRLRRKGMLKPASSH